MLQTSSSSAAADEDSMTSSNNKTVGSSWSKVVTGDEDAKKSAAAMAGNSPNQILILQEISLKNIELNWTSQLELLLFFEINGKSNERDSFIKKLLQ